jgi:hypothetical protein
MTLKTILDAFVRFVAAVAVISGTVTILNMILYGGA